MIEWWRAFSANWSWGDPSLVLGLVTIVVTAFIPIALWWLGVKQTRRDALLNELQTQISRRQRRDALSEIVGRSSDATHLGLLWREIHEYEGEDRDLLLAIFRTNVALALPGTSTGVQVQDELNDNVVSQYVGGLERRYAEDTRGIRPYPGLLDFIVAVKIRGAKLETSKIVELVTGPTAEKQRPSHGFYRELVNVLPGSASGLLYAVERIDSWSTGGLKLNVLTGTLLAIKDMEVRWPARGSRQQADTLGELRFPVAQALAHLLHRDNLRSFDHWSLEGSTEPVSATVAWLIRAVGWLADTDSHVVMRMVENLASAIESIPASDRGWGIDDRDVRQGFEWIREKRPALWERYGAGLESAATGIGAWKAEEHDNG